MQAGGQFLTSGLKGLVHRTDAKPWRCSSTGVAICPVTKSTFQIQDAEVECFSHSLAGSARWHAKCTQRSISARLKSPRARMPVHQYGSLSIRISPLLDRWQSCPLMVGIPRCPGGERRISPCGAHRHNQITILVVLYAEHLRPVWKRRQQEAAALQRRNFSFSSRVCQRP